MKQTQRLGLFEGGGPALRRVPAARVLEFESLLSKERAVSALFQRLRALFPPSQQSWTFYPDCLWQPAGSSFRRKKVGADTVTIWASIGQEIFYVWITEDAKYQAFLLDDDQPGVEPASFDEVLCRAREILDPATGLIGPDRSLPQEPTFQARYRAWDEATRRAGTR